jgi:hypothetical protein
MVKRTTVSASVWKDILVITVNLILYVLLELITFLAKMKVFLWDLQSINAHAIAIKGMQISSVSLESIVMNAQVG